MKKLYLILSLALILCFMVGCQDKAAMAELEEFKAQAEMEAKNIELIKRKL
jgi:Tfp pilus assembly protein PilP